MGHISNMVIGIEKFTDQIGTSVEESLGTLSDSDYEAAQGLTSAAQAALLMRRYLHEFDAPREAFGGFPLTAHANGVGNPNAMFRKAIKAELYNNAGMVSDPLNMFDVAPNADGAAALIIASGAAVEKYGLTPIARIVGGATAGVPPRIMGFGPAPATKKLCARIGMSPQDFDVVELNEAFASQGIAVLRDLGIAEDGEHVNPNGGAIALGHPLGMSGARLAGTAVMELRERGARRAIATMCIGVGQGIACAFEAV